MRVFLAIGGLAVGLLFEPAVAHADPSSSGASPAELRTYGVLALVGGAAITAPGVWFLVDGLKPCPASHDCSTRGLGVVLGAPFLVVGVGTLVVGGTFVEKASRIEEERRAATVTFVPVVGPRGLGGALNVRF